MILGPIPFFVHNNSIVLSNKPVTEPKELRSHNLDKDKSAFVKSFYASFWVIGGETIGFFHKGRIKTFGRQISSNDADTLIALTKKHLA